MLCKIDTIPVVYIALPFRYRSSYYLFFVGIIQHYTSIAHAILAWFEWFEPRFLIRIYLLYEL